MLSDLGGWPSFVTRPGLSDSATDEVRGILVSAPPSPFHSQILSLGRARDGIWAMVVFRDDE